MTSYNFSVRRKSLPLFGVLDTDDWSRFYDEFARRGDDITISFDETAAGFLEDDLELDVESVAHTPWRYVQGMLRPKAVGLGGTTLGDFGEALVYLVYRAESIPITRVIGSSADKGVRPMPDFWLDPERGHTIIEVKSTEALDVRDLQAFTGSWKFVQPCNGLAARRIDALWQLGYDETGTDQGFTHQLHLPGGRKEVFPPLPARHSEAWIVMVRDGRIESARLPNDDRLRTPPLCRQAGRDCWTCIGPSTSPPHAIVMQMPNSPGRIPLLTPPEGPGMFAAYSRWAQAIWSRELKAVAMTTGALARETITWIRGLNHENLGREDSHESWWGTYISGALRDTGMNAAIPGFGEENLFVFADERYAQRTLARSTESSRRDSTDMPHEPVAQWADESELRSFFVDRDRRVPRRMCCPLRTTRHDALETISLSGTPDDWSARACMSPWWLGESVSLEQAGILAWRFVRAFSASILLEDLWPVDPINSLRMEPCEVGVGQLRTLLGFTLSPPLRGRDRRFPFSWLDLSPPMTWMSWLAWGDQRAKLRVFADGRIHLRVRNGIMG